MRLSTLILAALGAGTLFGALLNRFFVPAIAPLDEYLLSPLGQAFLRLIQFVVVPIVFSSLILGLSRIGQAGQLGRYLVKLLTCYLFTSFVALCIGMITAWLLQPGIGVSGVTLSHSAIATQTPSLLDWLISLIPINPLEALSNGNLLQIIFAAALFGIGIGRAQEKAEPFVNLMESLYTISEQVLAVILYVAPVGVFALISSAIATQGLALITGLLLYIVGLLIATAVMIGLYVAILILLQAKPVKFFQALAPALSLAFGTASSNAALPIVLQNIQENYGLREEIASVA